MTTHVTKTWIEDGKLITEVFEEKEIYKYKWVGLTDEEWSEVYNRKEWDTEGSWEYERAIEAALRSKNT